MSRSRAVHGTVGGRVQGVGFRWSTWDRARTLGLEGWVRNLPDGRVEVHVQGDDVDAMIRFLHDGPPGALVREVDLDDVRADDSLVGFEIR